MLKQIVLDKVEITYKLKLSQRAKRLRLALYNNGNLIITAPKNLNPKIVEKFLLEKADWIIKKLNYFKNNPRQFSTKGTRQEYLQYKKQALILAQARLAYFSKIYNYKFNKISIRNQTTRWGSCSKKGNLNFNFKIALLPDKLADYIIVHEMCHLKEFNHSKKFWNLVQQIIPDYLKLRRELKRGKIGII